MSCIFCKICAGEAPSDMIYQDDEIAVFKDIKPVAKYHYLAIPKVHIKDCKQLTLEHKPLIEKLVNEGKRILADKGADISNILMGFHWPPFNSVSHLHLHLITPASEMGLLHRYMFKPNSLWFVTVDYVMEHLVNNKL